MDEFDYILYGIVITVSILLAYKIYYGTMDVPTVIIFFILSVPPLLYFLLYEILNSKEVKQNG